MEFKIMWGQSDWGVEWGHFDDALGWGCRIQCSIEGDLQIGRTNGPTTLSREMCAVLAPILQAFADNELSAGDVRVKEER